MGINGRCKARMSLNGRTKKRQVKKMKIEKYICTFRRCVCVMYVFSNRKGRSR